MTESKFIEKPNGLPPCWAFNPQGDEAMSPENLSRRAIMAGAATLPALAVPALTSSAAPDPIFAALEKYRASHF